MLVPMRETPHRYLLRKMNEIIFKNHDFTLFGLNSRASKRGREIELELREGVGWLRLTSLLTLVKKNQNLVQN